MPICCYCMANVKDLARHQRHSEQCRIFQRIRAHEGQGWRLLLDYAPDSWRLRGFQVLPDGRLAVGPFNAVQQFRRLRVYGGIYAKTQDGFWDAICRTIRAHLADQAMQAGGQIPFRRLAGCEPLVAIQFRTLVRWAQEGLVDAMIERYRHWTGPASFEEVPEYVNDRRVLCDRCGDKVSPKSLREHRRRKRCVLRWLRRTKQMVIMGLAGSELTEHPVWSMLEGCGVPVSFVPIRDGKALRVLVVAPERFDSGLFKWLRVAQKDSRWWRIAPHAPLIDWGWWRELPSWFRIVEKPLLDLYAEVLADPAYDWRTEMIASCMEALAASS